MELCAHSIALILQFSPVGVLDVSTATSHFREQGLEQRKAGWLAPAHTAGTGQTCESAKHLSPELTGG